MLVVQNIIDMVKIPHKICPECCEDLPLTAYRISKNGYYRRTCKTCRNLEQRALKEKNPEKHKESHRKSMFKRKYGITIDQYNLMFLKQEGKCAICGTHQSELNHTLSVDHCHATNIIRGLLCSKCNTGIGYFNDNAKFLASAASYLGLKVEDK